MAHFRLLSARNFSINYVNVQGNYVNMQHKYVDMQSDQNYLKSLKNQNRPQVTFNMQAATYLC